MPNDPQLLPNWVTAISTAVTAAVATGGGILAWIGLTRESKTRLPTIEAHTTSSDLQCGRVIELHVVIRNNLRETLLLNRIEIVRPRTMVFATANYDVSCGGIFIQPTTDKTITSVAEIAPFGGDVIDTIPTTYYFIPPPSWLGGTIEIEFRFSSKAETIRDKRITIKRHVTVASNMKTDEIAKSQA